MPSSNYKDFLISKMYPQLIPFFVSYIYIYIYEQWWRNILSLTKQLLINYKISGPNQIIKIHKIYYLYVFIPIMGICFYIHKELFIYSCLSASICHIMSFIFLVKNLKTDNFYYTSI